MKKLLLAAALLLCSVPAHSATTTPLEGQSADVAAASAVATLTGVATKTTYLSTVIIKANGATTGGCVQVAITGASVGTINWNYCFPGGAAVPANQDVIYFHDHNVYAPSGGNLVVTLPSLGTGNLHASVTALGYAQ